MSASQDVIYNFSDLEQNNNYANRMSVLQQPPIQDIDEEENPELSSFYELLQWDIELQKRTDFTFIVGPQALRIPVHKLILYFRTKVFENQSTNIQETECTLPDVPLKVFIHFIRYVYTDVLEVDIEVGDLMILLNLAKTLEVPLLITECINRLNVPVSLNNCLEIYSATSAPDHIHLKEQAFKFILKNARALFSSDSGDRILHLTESDLRTLIERDELQCSEVEVFKTALRWATFHSSSASDVQKTFKPFVNLIRFSQMSSREVADEVVHTGVLNRDQMFELYTYINASENRRIIMKLFNTKPRAASLDHDVELNIENLEPEVPGEQEEIYDQRVAPVIEIVSGSSMDKIQNDASSDREHRAVAPHSLLPTPTCNSNPTDTVTTAKRKRKSRLNVTASESPELVTTVEENSMVTTHCVRKQRNPAQQTVKSQKTKMLKCNQSATTPSMESQCNAPATESPGLVSTIEDSLKGKKKRVRKPNLKYSESVNYLLPTYVSTLTPTAEVIEENFDTRTTEDCEASGVSGFYANPTTDENQEMSLGSTILSPPASSVSIPSVNLKVSSTDTKQKGSKKTKTRSRVTFSDCNSVIGFHTGAESNGNEKVVRITVTEISSTDSIPLVIPIPNNSPSTSTSALEMNRQMKKYSLIIDLKIEREDSYKRFVNFFNIRRYLSFVKKGEIWKDWNMNDLWSLNIPITIKVNKSTLLKINPAEKELTVSIGFDSIEILKGVPKTYDLRKLNLVKTNLPTETRFPPRVQQSTYEGFPTKFLEEVWLYNVWCDSIKSLGKFTQQCPNLVKLCSYLITPIWDYVQLDLTSDLVSGGKLQSIVLSEAQLNFQISQNVVQYNGVTELVLDRCRWTAEFVQNIHKIFPNIEKVAFREHTKRYWFWDDEETIVFNIFPLRMLINLLKITSLKSIRIWGMVWNFYVIFPPKDNGKGKWTRSESHKGLEVTKEEKKWMETFLKKCGVRIPCKGNFLIERDEEGNWKGKEFDDKEPMNKKGGFWEYQEQMEYEQFQLHKIYEDCETYGKCFFKEFYC